MCEADGSFICCGKYISCAFAFLGTGYALYHVKLYIYIYILPIHYHLLSMAVMIVFSQSIVGHAFSLQHNPTKLVTGLEAANSAEFR